MLTNPSNPEEWPSVSKNNHIPCSTIKKNDGVKSKNLNKGLNNDNIWKV